MTPPRTSLTRRGLLRLAVVAVAVIAAIVPISARLVEHWYSNGFYALLQARLTPVTNLIPIALLDLAGALVVAGFVRQAARLRGARLMAVIRDALGSLAVFAAALYLAFLVLWGLNYRRTPLREKLAFDSSRVTRPAAVALAGEAVSLVNGLHARAHAEGQTGVSLQQAFADAQRALGQPRIAAVGVPSDRCSRGTSGGRRSTA